MQNEAIFAGFAARDPAQRKDSCPGGDGARSRSRMGAFLWPGNARGTAYCMVVISDRPIGSPIIKNPRHLVAMNLPSLEKFAPLVKPRGVVLINSSLISIRAGRNDVDEMVIPVTDIAKDLGNVKVANIVALAAFVARSRIVDFDLLREAVTGNSPEREICLHSIWRPWIGVKMQR